MLHRTAALTTITAAVIAPTPATGAQSEPRACVPELGLLVRDTVRRSLASGSEVTEPLADGAYRVTRCTDTGTPRISMTVVAIGDPDGGRRLVPSVVVEPDRVRTYLFGEPSEAEWAALWRGARQKVRDAVLARTPGDATRDPNYRGGQTATATLAAGGACSDSSYELNPGRWPDDAYSWRWNAKSFGGEKRTQQAFEAAHEAWDRSVTNCDNLHDDTTIAPDYRGTTTRKAGTKDGVGVIDHGKISGGACEGAIACTYVWRNDQGYTESDTRFSTDVRWSNTGADDAYDYRAVATHEIGHGIGLADLRGSPNLTMSYITHAGNTAPRTLGRGDILGMRQIYGG
ncbi:MAG: matrixin family metalloprotease [Solirubrobacteraceae bacterium]|nr:matrixin family metalloprotease [Solirubrobacteraceae bacterium]